MLIGLRFISGRDELLEASKILETAALDPYEFVRDGYLQRRRNQVYDGNPPDDDIIKSRSKPMGNNFAPPAYPGSMDDGHGALIYSGDSPPTPAELEARRAASAAAPAAPPVSETTFETQQQKPNMVRVWLPFDHN
mgnify:CR=1 FL=1